MRKTPQLTVATVFSLLLGSFQFSAHAAPAPDKQYLRVTEKSILDAAYNAEIKALEPRLEIKAEALEATLEEIAQTDPRAKKSDLKK
ncbi:MAG: hypothetical protein GEU77_05875 [Deltaproteobacteria bacterium]|nr:hypothetical protein [Deltaproteobacteria bacterium]